MAGRSLEEVEQQIRILQAEAEQLRLAEGIEQLRVVIRKYKVGLSHFRIALGADRKRRPVSKKLSPTHRNPDNPAQTWTGRGRKPRWLVAALDAGMIEQCRIGHPAPADTLQPHQSAIS
jgi:DNA-binding protein H-NS